MAQTIKLRRSAVAGNRPTTAQLDLGELAINTVDGKIYFEKSASGVESIQEIFTTNASKIFTSSVRTLYCSKYLARLFFTKVFSGDNFFSAVYPSTYKFIAFGETGSTT